MSVEVKGPDQVIIAFAHHLDHREFPQAAALFAVDGIWDRHGDRLVGREQILGVMSDRPDAVVERHVMTTIHVEQVSPTECLATSYVLIFRSTDGPATPIEASGPHAVGEFHDRMVLTSDGWRIAHRSATPVFTVVPQ